MPGRVIRRPMFRGRVEPRNPMGILASSPQLAGAVNRAHGGFNNPHPPVKYAQAGFFNQAQAGTPGMSLSSVGNVRPGQSVGVGVDIDQIVRDAQNKAASPSFNLPGAVGVVGQPPVRSGPVGAPANGIMGVFSQGESPEIKEGMGIGTGKPVGPITQTTADALVDEGIIKASALVTPDDYTSKGDKKDDAKDNRRSVSEAIAGTLNDGGELQTELEARAAGTSGSTKDQQNLLTEQNTALTDIQKKAAAESKSLSQKIDKLTATKSAAATTLEGIVDKFEKEKVDPKKARDDVSFSDVYDETVKEMGFSDKDIEASYKDDKTQSFWLSVMKAGLAIAAGESPNALTNVAKGLMFGMESWGRDMKDLNAMEREDRKEFRAALRQNLKSEKDTAIALATNANSVLATQLNLEMQVANAQSDAEIAAINAEIQKSSQVFANYQFEVGIQNAITNNKVTMAKLESDDEATKLEALFKLRDLAISNLNAQTAMMPEKLKTIAMMGEDYMYEDPDTGQFILTDKGNLTLLSTLKDSTNYKATYASVDDFARHVMSSDTASESVKSIYRNFLRQNGQDVASSDIDMSQAINHAYNIMGFANAGGAQTNSGASSSGYQVGQAVDPSSNDFVRMRDAFESSGQNEMQTPSGAVYSYDGSQIVRVR